MELSGLLPGWCLIIIRCLLGVVTLAASGLRHDTIENLLPAVLFLLAGFRFVWSRCMHVKLLAWLHSPGNWHHPEWTRYSIANLISFGINLWL